MTIPLCYDVPTLACVIAEHSPIPGYVSGHEVVHGRVVEREASWIECGGCGAVFNSGVAHAEHVNAVWREACTISSADQLDGLPVGTLIRLLAAGIDTCKLGDGWEATGEWPSYSGAELAGRLPALVLWHPSWTSEIEGRS
ncbi:hypothetical protein JF729_07170 [Mycobacterium intracellulare]|uniref:hypothetical protein n=1 Tax=Mycobacterium intracellulare TaxID=1767 RepID=UPI001CD92E59|nr:hypothetical protein [Mycobacterium intracellulare]MCA2247577.1 hypothetical protein [Mycobacterium intracellulare]